MSARELACREAVELFSDYLEGALPPELAALCEAHLRECGACLRYLAQLRISVEALRSIPSPLEPGQRESLVALFRATHGKEPGGSE